MTHSSRLKSLFIIVSCLTVVLLCRLIQLQLFDYKHFETLSQKNQISLVPVMAPRGIITDRNGIVLADNIPVYTLEIIPELNSNLTLTLQALQQLLPSISADDIQLFFRLKKQQRSFVPIALKMKLSLKEISIFALNQHRFPGVQITAKSMRYYPYGEEMAHVLGYVGRITLEELNQLDRMSYQAMQFIGKTGIEHYYELQLRGKNGFEQAETNAYGRTMRVLKHIAPQIGDQLTLTLDARLQHVAYQALANHYGAVVLMDVKTGGILAMVSQPSFDPNSFVNGIPAKTYQKLAQATERPLYNRAIRGLYPPASTIKPYIALTGLQSGVIDPSTTLYDPGFYRLPGVSHVYHDWNKRGHGPVNIYRAIAVSCDPYFYHLGHLLGIQPMHRMLTQFGFGRLTHVDLSEEISGIVPSVAWKKRARKAAWYPGDSLITAIGQGFMLASPLQMATAATTLAQKGHHLRPHLLHVRSDDHNQKIAYTVMEENYIRLHDEDYWNIIHESMHGVTTSPEGTGYRFGRNPPYPVAAKTGTAQVFGGKEYMRRLHQVLPMQLRDHSLFIAFTPVETPEVAIAVVVEHDVLASQVARQVLDYYHELYHKDSAA